MIARTRVSVCVDARTGWAGQKWAKEGVVVGHGLLLACVSCRGLVVLVVVVVVVTVVVGLSYHISVARIKE